MQARLDPFLSMKYKSEFMKRIVSGRRLICVGLPCLPMDWECRQSLRLLLVEAVFADVLSHPFHRKCVHWVAAAQSLAQLGGAEVAHEVVLDEGDVPLALPLPQARDCVQNRPGVVPSARYAHNAVVNRQGLHVLVGPKVGHREAFDQIGAADDHDPRGDGRAQGVRRPALDALKDVQRARPARLLRLPGVHHGEGGVPHGLLAHPQAVLSGHQALLLVTAAHGG
mmetsp:Transcript_2377/g.5984  ORF Transcript_2377/g.5984 Transcript_2377/m.5984 type:complete len:225 (+) Transcript_2377:1713-2387(+)